MSPNVLECGCIFACIHLTLSKQIKIFLYQYYDMMPLHETKYLKCYPALCRSRSTDLQISKGGYNLKYGQINGCL